MVLPQDDEQMGLTTALNKILTDEDINGSNQSINEAHTMVSPQESNDASSPTDGQTMGLTTALNKILKDEDINGSNHTSNLDIPDFVESESIDPTNPEDRNTTPSFGHTTEDDLDDLDNLDDPDDGNDVPPNRPSILYTLTHNKASIALLVIILVLIIGIIVTLVLFMNASNQRIDVINHVGSTSEQVQQWCSDNKLDETHCVFTMQYSETVPEDNIIAQSIESGSTMSENDTITFTVSQGKDPDYEVTLPDFSTMNETEVMQWFQDNLFTDVTYEYQVDPDAEDGSFLSINITTPSAKRSDAILVTFAITEARLGVEIEMPDLSGYTKANVVAWAAENRISVTYTNEYSDTIENGMVISQSVKAGTMIKTGDKLTVTISIGKAILMEDMVGSTRETVANWCNENGLKCNFTQSRYSTQQKGLIIDQNVKTGSQVSLNQTLSFTLSLGSTIEVGDYTNKDYSLFEQQIEALNKLGAGLSIARSNVVTNTRGDDNLVTSNTQTIEINGSVNVSVNVYQAKQVTVPQCSGSRSDYEKTLQDNGLQGTFKGQRYSESVSNGHVMSCSINGGTNVNEGTYIDFYTSKGAYRPNANDFNNLTVNEANTRISNARNEGADGWTIDTSDRQYNGSVASGRTFNCSISGKTIYCSVSQGAEPTITIGNYIGTKWDSTTNSWNISDGIILRNVGATDSNQPQGTILTQSINAGEVIRGQTSVTVNVTVSRGPQDPISNGTSWSSLCSSGNSCVVNGITINANLQYHDTVADGTIISHSCDMNQLSCSANVSQGPQMTTITLSEITGFGVSNGATSADQVMATLRSSFSTFSDRMSYEFGQGSYDFSRFTPYEMYYVFNGERHGPYTGGSVELPVNASLVFRLQQ